MNHNEKTSTKRTKTTKTNSHEPQKKRITIKIRSTTTLQVILPKPIQNVFSQQLSQQQQQQISQQNALPQHATLLQQYAKQMQLKKYESIKKHNNQTGEKAKDWYWYDKLDVIFGTHENITPLCLVNKSTGIIEEP
ncbi:776_t:CDS:2 [Funneliformis geosporum]|uniref:776_t:CDS:1 n=1 Tax=Funneliformis geosporum TaxID=1117311 RepID=A0A9W4WZ81_9GLOM|nr:776_t:CDS:2 [Funneliformis geosporum]